MPRPAGGAEGGGARPHAKAAPRPASPSPKGAAGDDGAAEEPRIALVDGSNVAHAAGEPARLRNITLVMEKLAAEGLRPVVVADAALRHQIDDADGYERLREEGKLRQAPAGTDADYFILPSARELDAAIVSNDTFRDRAKAFPEARDRVIRFMIVPDEVVLERRTKRRE
jgi:hypothetical protein